MMQCLVHSAAHSFRRWAAATSPERMETATAPQDVGGSCVLKRCSPNSSASCSCCDALLRVFCSLAAVTTARRRATATRRRQAAAAARAAGAAATAAAPRASRASTRRPRSGIGVPLMRSRVSGSAQKKRLKNAKLTTAVRGRSARQQSVDKEAQKRYR